MTSRNIYSVMVYLHSPIPTPILIHSGILKLVRYPFFSYSCCDPVPFHRNTLEQESESESGNVNTGVKKLSQGDYESKLLAGIN